MTFLGHASTVIEMDGVRLVTDPVLRRTVGPLYRRVPRPLTGPLVDPDAILISHLHLDHYDPRSLRLFRRDTPVFAPVGAGSCAGAGSRTSTRSRPASGCASARWRSSPRTPGTAGPATRWRRGPRAWATSSRGPTPWTSRATRRSSPHRRRVAERLDLACCPSPASAPLMPEFKHMSPRHAVQAMELLRPRLVVPIHWGTYHLPGTALFRFARTSTGGRRSSSWRRRRHSSRTCTP